MTTLLKPAVCVINICHLRVRAESNPREVLAESFARQLSLDTDPGRGNPCLLSIPASEAASPDIAAFREHAARYEAKDEASRIRDELNAALTGHGIGHARHAVLVIDAWQEQWQDDDDEDDASYIKWTWATPLWVEGVDESGQKVLRAKTKQSLVCLDECGSRWGGGRKVDEIDGLSA